MKISFNRRNMAAVSTRKLVFSPKFPFSPTYKLKRSIKFITSSIKTIPEINDCIYYHDSANTIDFSPPHHFPLLCSLYRPLAAGKLAINPTDSTNRSLLCHSPSSVSEHNNSRLGWSFPPISHQGPLLETIYSLHGAPETGCCQLAILIEKSPLIFSC